jgi:hypothetical protein
VRDQVNPRYYQRKFPSKDRIPVVSTLQVVPFLSISEKGTHNFEFSFYAPMLVKYINGAESNIIEAFLKRAFETSNLNRYPAAAFDALPPKLAAEARQEAAKSSFDELIINNELRNRIKGLTKRTYDHLSVMTLTRNPRVAAVNLHADPNVREAAQYDFDWYAHIQACQVRELDPYALPNLAAVPFFCRYAFRAMAAANGKEVPAVTYEHYPLSSLKAAGLIKESPVEDIMEVEDITDGPAEIRV